MASSKWKIVCVCVLVVREWKSSCTYLCPQALCLAVAKIVIRPVRNLLLVQANAFFFTCSNSKMCVLICGHRWIWARQFCVAGAMFCDVAKNTLCIFAGRRAEFAFFRRFGCFFFVFCLGGVLSSSSSVSFEIGFSCRRNAGFPFSSWKTCVLTCAHQWIWTRPFFVASAMFLDIAQTVRLGGVRVGGGWWGHNNVLSAPSNDVTLLTPSLDVNTSMMLRSVLLL